MEYQLYTREDTNQKVQELCYLISLDDSQTDSATKVHIMELDTPFLLL
ncbi:MAG: hypothetical protein R3A43_04235 [Bacteroidia bacterium]